ncbi:MAG: FliM/FliN family flagellar motor switch protein [Acidobacteriia bacterium]|nr:FliM/FliN family flagellar motor switch protein [Terriglobia bacterium]
MEKVLNQQEIDAMVRAARSGNAADAIAAGPVVQPWDIRQAGQVGRDQLRSINQLHELFARNLTHAIGAYLRIVFECSLVSAEHLTYREFLQRLPEKTYLASCNLAPVGVIALLQLDLAIAFPLIDVLLGGEGQSSEAVRDVTEIEEQVLEGVVRIICRELQTTWDAISLEFNFGQRQQISQAQRLMVPDEKNLCLSFEIKMSDTRGTVNLAVPAVISNALLRKISADLSYQRPHSPIEARRQIEKKLLDCAFSVELSLPHLHVPLQSLAELTPGAVLPFSRNASAPAVLQVEEVRLCMAAPVRVNARRAARVLSLEPATPRTGEP